MLDFDNQLISEGASSATQPHLRRGYCPVFTRLSSGLLAFLKISPRHFSLERVGNTLHQVTQKWASVTSLCKRAWLS